MSQSKKTEPKKKNKDKKLTMQKLKELKGGAAAPGFGHHVAKQGVKSTKK